MPDIPFRIPESLASYMVQYESSPDKTIQRLKKQLKKRGPDAVGYFALGWLYHRQGLEEEALVCALKAKNFAPGSPFFDRLHYFFSHPRLFEAWKGHSPNGTSAGDGYQSQIGSFPNADLDDLIQKLSAAKSKHIKLKEEDIAKSESSSKPNAQCADEVVTETLAQIHEKQGKTGAAIKAYEMLRNARKEKEDYYNEQIQRLREGQNPGSA
jgi:tetratricopeptide (TPR) repeat protein